MGMATVTGNSNSPGPLNTLASRNAASQGPGLPRIQHPCFCLTQLQLDLALHPPVGSVSPTHSVIHSFIDTQISIECLLRAVAVLALRIQGQEKALHMRIYNIWGY